MLQSVEENGETLPQTSRERMDHRVGGGDYFASRSETNAWAEANWPNADDLPVTDSPAVHVWEEGQCEDWWENMKDTNTVRSSAKFFEHGWFVVLCRHMALLLACDMVKSGELYRYPLCLLSIFLGAEKAEREKRGEQKPNGRLAVVYDIMSIWGIFLPVIGTMHGYTHERVCQLVFLMLYIVGMGLEDEFVYYHDLQTYSNLSKFIYGNYKQALRIIHTKYLVRSHMQESGISSPEVFYTWLVEEGEYLQNLCKTPPKETIKMEYFAKLDALQSCQRRLAEVCKAWIPYSTTARDKTNALETKHRNEQENERKLIADVQALEEHLEISSRWVEGSEEWLKAKKMLECLRWEDLTLLEQASYKMHKHIAKAMKTRSKSIQAAIKAYNEAAAALRPPHRIIQWEEVLDLTFLSEFDLLRDSREDIQERQWATPKNRQIMLEFFKLI
ncbi:hypothetical protein C8J55DRAFT_557633 [Lentinula edodes]|uniref:Uncharacterized protein n=1 Tax=Lentinula lateritia TaxID=40482 RepID=A0A9W9DXR8_9AGAR|nr:hypothetical protein C8J55DRAFT_557633 [Lentinula edodes]